MKFKPDVREGEKKPNCKSCPFALKGRPQHKPVRPSIPSGEIQGVLLGESPGKDEAAMGEPFVGFTGEALNEVIAENGLDRNNLLIANCIGCLPPTGLKNEANMREAAKACRPWTRSILHRALSESGAGRIPVLAMGKWAGFLATGKARAIGDARGFIRRTPRFSPLILTWHPTFALFRNPWASADFSVDFDRFARAIRNELQPLPKAVVKPTLKQLKKLLKEPYVSLDIETGSGSKAEPWSGKDPTRNTLKVLGLGTVDVGYAMWWKGQSDDIKRLVRRILQSRRILKVVQNGHWFDLRVLRRLGFVVRNVIDTRDIRRALSTTSRLSLGYMSSVYLDVPPWKEKADDGKE